MRRLIIPFVLLVGVLTLAASGLADPGDKGKGKAQGKNKFSFQLTTTDRRCDGSEPWATLTEKRTYQLHKNKDGSYRLRRVDKGTFTTIDGKSPGNCHREQEQARPAHSRRRDGSLRRLSRGHDHGRYVQEERNVRYAVLHG